MENVNVVPIMSALAGIAEKIAGERGHEWVDDPDMAAIMLIYAAKARAIRAHAISEENFDLRFSAWKRMQRKVKVNA